LINLPLHDAGKKHGQKPPAFHVASKPIQDFDIEAFNEPLLAAALPDDIVVLDAELQTKTTLKASARCVKWHPHFKGLLLSLASNDLCLWDVERPAPAHTLTTKDLFDAAFLNDGMLASTSKGLVQLWDARTEKKPVQVRRSCTYLDSLMRSTGSSLSSRPQDNSRYFLGVSCTNDGD
jgi:WD40 repeat protein